MLLIIQLILSIKIHSNSLLESTITHNEKFIVISKNIFCNFTDGNKILRHKKYNILFYAHKKGKIYKQPLKIFQEPYFIERGKILLIVTKKSVFKVKDFYPVPDFTVPFIAFSTCGTFLGLLFNLIINNN